MMIVPRNVWWTGEEGDYSPYLPLLSLRSSLLGLFLTPCPLPLFLSHSILLLCIK